MGKALSDNEEMTIERHLDKESYAVICDELKTGVTLIFYLQNVMDYLDYLYSGKDFNADDFNPDRKNEIGKVPIRNKKGGTYRTVAWWNYYASGEKGKKF